MRGDVFSRRSVLRGIAAGAVGVGLVGTAAGQPTGDHIVVCRSPAGVRAAQAGASRLRHASIDMGRFGTAVAGRFPDAALRGLQNNPGVRYIAPDATMRAVAQTTPWGVSSVNAPSAWGTTTGTGAHVAVLDTGIYPHTDLPALGESKDYTGSSVGYSDVDGHGTHVAGTVAAVNDSDGVVGVAHGVTLHSVKVLGDNGSGSFSALMDAISWVAGRGWGPTVINMSLGADLRGGRYQSLVQALNETTQNAYSSGVLLVAAAGNSGRSGDNHYPSACPAVIAVSATNSNDTLASFSNYGDTIELAAPGVGVLSTTPNDTYSSYSGTSMASPHVAGVGALVMSSDLTNTETRQRLHETAKDLGASGWDQYYGYGLVDATAALDGSGGGSGGTTNAAPDVSLVSPSDGQTVSGTSYTVQIGASDADGDPLTVKAVIDGSEYDALLNAGTGYYEYSWDTTGASEGEHTVGAMASDDTDTSTAPSVTVTVDNEADPVVEENPPSVDSATLSTEKKGPWTHHYVDWTVSDPDGDLATVTVSVPGESDVQTVSGGSASGSSRVKSRDGVQTVTVTVEDSGGRVDSKTAPYS